MSRVYYVRDARGSRQLEERDLPVSIGGAELGDIVLPDLPGDALVAHIGLAEGHAFIQPAQTDVPLFHNHEHLLASRWLKSGDVVEAAESAVDWKVQGDQVEISVRERPVAAGLTPPASPPPTIHRPLPDVAQTVASPPGHRLWRRLAAAVFLLLLVAVGFVLLAIPVTVNITPQPESRSVHGFPPAVSIAGRQLIFPGRYLVTASLTGYRPLEQDIDVRSGGLQVFDFALEELPGRVSFDLQPDVPFRLYIDDSEVPTGPGNLAEIPGGNYRARIETQRYLAIEGDLNVAGKGEEQRVAHLLQPAWSDVTINSQPAGAIVSVDGKALGQTPLETQILQGERELALTLELYKRLVLKQRFEAGTTLVLDTLPLQALDGRLTINSQPPAASVTVDGAFRGTTPITLELTSGIDHQLRLSKPGYRSFDQTLQLAADQEKSLDAQLEPQYGVVFVTAQPADATLRVDGREVGSATQRLRLTARSHTLEFSKPGYVSSKVTVTPSSGASKNVDIKLQTLQQARRVRKAGGSSVKVGSPARHGLRPVRPQGVFSMGASRREAGRRANESRRLVELVRPFYLASREVSNAEYRKFKPGHSSGSAEGGSLDLDNQPVVNVSWDDAARYCNWLSRREGLPPAYTESNGRMRGVSPMTVGYRLPSEAEWAYVARKHTRASEQRYPWGSGFPPQSPAGNFADDSIADTLANTVPDYNDGYRVSAPVASFTARPQGFFDLGGNAAEWTHDYYTVYPGEAGKPVKDPLGPVSGDHHVVRDSSWRQGTITELRLSYRDYSRTARPDLGFRVARYMN